MHYKSCNNSAIQREKERQRERERGRISRLSWITFPQIYSTCILTMGDIGFNVIWVGLLFRVFKNLGNGFCGDKKVLTLNLFCFCQTWNFVTIRTFDKFFAKVIENYRGVLLNNVDAKRAWQRNRSNHRRCSIKKGILKNFANKGKY